MVLHLTPLSLLLLLTHLTASLPTTLLQPQLKHLVSSLLLLSDSDNKDKECNAFDTWCTARCIALIVNAGDSTLSALLNRLLTPAQIVDATIKWQNECSRLAIEQAAATWFVTPPGGSEPTTTHLPLTPQKRKYDTMDHDSFPTYHGWPLPPPSEHYVQVCGIDLPRRRHSADANESRFELILTPSMQRNIEQCVLALCTSPTLPILVEGPPSSGKSALITHLARLVGAEPDLVRIHLDDQTDSKTLLGAYICAAKPGEFIWQPGLITQAVQRGSWVVIEDINMASAEVLATLLPLIERRTLHVPSRGEELTAAPGFQLIATVTTGSTHIVKDFLGGLFHLVRMEPPSIEEQIDIACRLYPSVAPLIPFAMDSIILTTTTAGGELSIYFVFVDLWVKKENQIL